MRLPAEILVAVFQALDSIERVRCRRVCPLWNDILTTDAHFPDVRVSGTYAQYTCGDYPRNGMYWVIACLMKSLGPCTKVAVVSRENLHDGLGLSAPFHHALPPGRRLPVLVLHDCGVGVGLDGMSQTVVRTAELLVQCRTDTIMWKNCRFACENWTAVVAQVTWRVESRQQMEIQLWDLWERGVPSGPLVDRQTLQEWIMSLGWDTWNTPRQDLMSVGHQLKILQALNGYQSADPRESSHYRQREWTASNIPDLDAGRLSTLTVAVLSHYLREAH
ncbi:uncharacterized protein LOC129601745 [Paramacrobiotus metropolitanus]|uniref:uncharacterized protein LOC129601745 n=1 Tax=Paramacrobiotus metropolitanus TaxID=2943436 RepID=UPI002445C264|nr:uncharacterized protein LOC129601745 [Paramacrobiotus metropolitanus]